MSNKQKEDLADLRLRSPDSLREILLQDALALSQMRFKHAANPLAKGHLLREARRRVALLQTILNQRLRAHGEGT